jgi:prepilin-type processing-associated H-X9-DG protein
MVESASNFVVFLPTTPSCTVSVNASIANPVDAMNAVQSSLNSMSSRQGEGSSIAFADGHAKFYKARKDADVEKAWGAGAMLSVAQNKTAVLNKASTGSNAANGVMNCMNHNSAKLLWSPYLPMPGENTELDTMCTAKGQ